MASNKMNKEKYRELQLTIQEQQELTLKELVDKLGISISTIIKRNSGESAIKKESVLALHALMRLNLSDDEL